MEKLWSPWRSKYIESFNSEMSDDGCIFCEAAKQDTENPKSLVIHKAKLTYTLLNLYPYNNGHLMVVPFRHISEFTELTEEEGTETFKQLQLAQNALSEISKPQGFNIGANLGRTGGAGIDEHIHFHIVPRWNGDTNFMPVLGEVKVISQELMDTKLRLLNAYKKLL
ncbi:HIT domain-containing protein [Bacteroidota bacterium]